MRCAYSSVKCNYLGCSEAHTGWAVAAASGHCPIGELLGPDRESAHPEYKATLRMHVRPSAFPVEATVSVNRKGQLVEEQGLYVRVDNATKKLTDAERQKYLTGRWPAR